jgi:S-adenosylmethionine synthetase
MSSSLSGTSFLFSSESVTEGHPDKVADAISDTVLDAFIAQDPESLVACETLVTTGLVVLAGEISTSATKTIDFQRLVREAIRKIGYVEAGQGFDADSCAVLTALHEQSRDIRQGVKREDSEIGAGDQGMMFGYACNDTPEKMPITIALAHRITRKLADLRKSGELKWLRPDGKSQVTIEFRDGKPHRVHTVVVSTQHAPEVSQEEISRAVTQKVIKAVIPEELFKGDPVLHINPTGRFVIGGPHGDAGLTGRKIIVDTYGGNAPHGGGAFSGKDPTKVDRSAAYMARYIAKNVVASGASDRCQIQLAYAIGVADPVSVNVETFDTHKVAPEKIHKAVLETFSMKPAEIIRQLKLRRPIYTLTSAYGHFGRELPEFTWENTDKAAALKSLLSI